MSFHCAPLDDRDKRAYIQLAERTAHELVAYANLENGPIHWKSHSAQENLHVYQGFDPTLGASHNERTWCAVSEMQATIDEVQMMLFTDNSVDFRDCAKTFDAGVLDATRLYNLALPDATKPLDFVGINWVLQKSPGKGLIRNRDWCYVEGQFELTTTTNRRAWVRAYKSVHLACCPDLQADCGFVRGVHTRAGAIFVETARPGVLKVIQLHQGFVKGDSSGKVADWLYASSVAARYRKIHDLETTIRKYRLTQTTFLPANKLMPVDLCVDCTVCDRPFGKTKKLHCRKCGAVVCRHCSKLHQVKYQNQWVEVRVCEPCVAGQDTKHSTMAHIRSTVSSSTDEAMPLSQRSADDEDDEMDKLVLSCRDTLIGLDDDDDDDASCEATASMGRCKPTYNPILADKFDSFFHVVQPQVLLPPRRLPRRS
ncbi:Aste57867_4985 [Aphanomyces stellatus]|uniref:Aste57867_4985 protein n=1 Tax=Aphanomyces stellatus TaxID=120398 RepID=A0A485KCN7_9STRA|nr:hypothetical protein As57867_004972 [Aphanomyces stellatus]VFT82072.1 Aste57867_4985 [Aphanomyces stellatus]